MLGAELCALLDHKALPLAQQFVVNVGEEERHLCVFSLGRSHPARVKLVLELVRAGKMLRHDNGADQLGGLPEHKFVLHEAPLLALLLQEAHQELVEELQHLILGALLRFR